MFLDIGANRGVSVRKLFEPDAYPIEEYDWDNAGLPRWHCCRNHSAPHDHIFYAPMFDEFFGTKLQRSRDHFNGVCAFGFEMNPQHTRRLKEIETCYASRGWRAKFFTETAASDVDGNTTMRLARGQDSEHNWGATVVPELFAKDTPWQTTVGTIDLAEWLIEHIFKRSIPPGELPPTVLAKLVSSPAMHKLCTNHFYGRVQQLSVLAPHTTCDCRTLKAPSSTSLGTCLCGERFVRTSYTP